LSAGNAYLQNSSVAAAAGVTSTAGGSMTFGPTATTVGSPVSYTANGSAFTPPPASLTPVTEIVDIAPTDYVVTFSDNFAQVLEAQNFLESVSNTSVTEASSAQPKTKASVEDPLKSKRKNKDDVVVEGQTCTP
jgi:hypothetical protein